MSGVQLLRMVRHSMSLYGSFMADEGDTLQKGEPASKGDHRDQGK
jgi:hypothetical protein